MLPDGAFPGAEEEPKDENTAGSAGMPPPSWYQTSKGRLVLGTGALLAAAWASRVVFPPKSRIGPSFLLR